MTQRRFQAACLALLLALMVSTARARDGKDCCADNKACCAQADKVPHEGAKVVMPSYVIEPPDVLQMKVSTGSPKHDLDGDFLVGCDGTISLGTFGRVKVAGLTHEQATQAVKDHMKAYVDTPRVALETKSFNSKAYYVVGVDGDDQSQVVRMPYTGNETVLDALSQAGELPAMNKAKVWVARPAAGNAKGDVLQVDWKAIVHDANRTTNYQLMPGDRVFVQMKAAAPATSSATTASSSSSTPCVNTQTATIQCKGKDGVVRDIVIEVREHQTGNLVFGINGSAGLTGSIMLNEKNFTTANVPNGGTVFMGGLKQPSCCKEGAASCKEGACCKEGAACCKTQTQARVVSAIVPPMPSMPALVPPPLPPMPAPAAPTTFTYQAVPVQAAPVYVELPLPQPAPTIAAAPWGSPIQVPVQPTMGASQCCVSAVNEDGKTKLHIAMPNSSCAAFCEQMSLKYGPNQAVQLATHGKQVLVRASEFQAMADQITNLGNGRVKLQGNVRLECRKNNMAAQVVTASQVVIGLTDGYLEVCQADASDQKDVFNFWTGFAR